MKQIKKSTGQYVLSAILAAAMFLSLLTGCGGRPDGTPAQPDPAAASGTGVPAEEDTRDLSQFVGVRDSEDMQISDEELDDIRMTVEMMEEGYRYNAAEGVEVENRDWTRYSSPLGKNSLTEAEAMFYDRLEELGQRYISNDALDGVKYGTWYISDRVLYGDLGLVKEQALNIVDWFLYNNPQYYFFPGGTSSSSYYTSLRLYDFVADGEDRAEVTNQLFDKLDGWIQDVDSQAATTWQKELLANNLLCLENVYETNDYDQSLYSAVMLGKTVCAGFAKSFCAMMNALDVGTTSALSYNEAERSGHAWNVVRFDDGNYYCVDVCWNNDDNSKTGYSNNYFNVGEADSKKSDFAKVYHTYETDYERYIPAIAAASYSPTAYDTDTKKPAEPPQPTPAPTPEPATEPTATPQTIVTSKPAPGSATEPVKTGPTAPDVTVLNTSGWISTRVSSSSGHFGDLHYYLFPDASFRDEEKHHCGDNLYFHFTHSIFIPGTTYYVGVRGEQESNGQWQYSDWTYFTATISVSEFERTDAPPVPRITTTADSITVTIDDPADARYWFTIYEDETRLSLLVPVVNKMQRDNSKLSYTWVSGAGSCNLEPGTTYYLSVYTIHDGKSSDITYFTATTLDK